MDLRRSKQLQRKAHAMIPGGCHTYAKGDDQYPQLSPGFIARGLGCHVWDVDGNEYIEYGMGNRSVTLGHAYEPVVRAAREEMLRGANFGRPSPLEVECAEELLDLIAGAEMAKFAKDGSSVTTAAVKLARAYTGRDLVAICSDHPFFATNDWFIGTTPLDAGIPQVVKDLTISFRYNDIESVRAVFMRHPGRVACLIMEPAKYDDPKDGFLHEVQRLCQQYGAVFILDEMITGFRWHLGGAQRYYDIVPDLSAFGKALANGFSLSALVGKREIMELGGLEHDKERVFLLSTTHGAETHALAAAIATMRVYRSEGVIEHLYRQGERLATGANQVITAHGLADFVQILGKPCSLVFATKDRNGAPSQAFRSLFLQEMIERGVFGPSFVVSYSHTDDDIDRTVEALEGVLPAYARALEDGVERYLVGPPSKSVYRRYNDPSVKGLNRWQGAVIPETPVPMTQDATQVGEELYALVERLYPIFRSVTGDGVRETLSVLSEYIPLEMREVQTGTPVLDWQIPQEWVFRDAFVKDHTGQRVIDVANSNLHVVSYSTGVHETMSWRDLRRHLHSLPEHPDWIPYRTTYFEEGWGFCLSHRQLLELDARGEQDYDVRIEASHRDGSLTYGEILVPGETEDEVMISTHVCHPSLANDNLSGIAVATYLARHIARGTPRYSYRFVFTPATIGAIAWLGANEHQLHRIRHGLVLSLLGDAGGITYKRSRQGDAEIDRVVAHVLAHGDSGFEVRDYSPIGYDERQYCSPGFNLPMGCLMRSPNGEFPEYHTSADDLNLVQPRHLADSWATCVDVLGVLEDNYTYVNQKPKGEPRLGPLGLYARYGSAESKQLIQQAVLWTLNLSDGRHALLDIAERSGLPFGIVREAANMLREHQLLQKAACDAEHRNEVDKTAATDDTTVLRQSLRRLG